jgi:triosephosphate isomerase
MKMPILFLEELFMSMDKRTIEDINVSGKRVIVRVDFNVPLDKDLNITDDNRIVGALPTIKYLVEHNAKVILVSHLGRPKNGPEDRFSMKPTAKRLSELLGQEVIMATDVIGEDAKAKDAALKDGEVLMLENVRFHKEETKNDYRFARELASMADIFVNDAFGTAHRAHASTAGIANYLPAVCGYLIGKEIRIMGKALANPERPFVAILGGAKVSDKIEVIENLIGKVDALIIGGGMAYTFFKAMGYEVGTSICEDDKTELAKSLMDKAVAAGVKFLLPVDNAVTKEYSADSEFKYVDSDKIEAGWMGLDIGPKTVEIFSNEIKGAKTVVWNGPMGVFEFPNYAVGTKAVAKAIAESGAISIVGGGDSAAAVEQLGYADKITHISTGGGASLEFLEGKILPGIDVLDDRNTDRRVAAGNWKMNKNPTEAVKFVTELVSSVEGAESEVIVGVPFVDLPGVIEATAGTNVKVSAQNMHWKDNGAYTGEISGPMLASMQIKYVIIGHSERREYFAETNETVNLKAKAALYCGLRPIICVGESLEQREAGQTEDHVTTQVKVALEGLTETNMGKSLIAYEPIWAIGTGKTASNDQANEVCKLIRDLVKELYNDEIATSIKILYGGSVNAGNAAELFAMSDIDGGLVGGASLKVDDFSVIAKA